LSELTTTRDAEIPEKRLEFLMIQSLLTTATGQKLPPESLKKRSLPPTPKQVLTMENQLGLRDKHGKHGKHAECSPNSRWSSVLG
jgi:hypothetical protein